MAGLQQIFEHCSALVAFRHSSAPYPRNFVERHANVRHRSVLCLFLVSADDPCLAPPHLHNVDRGRLGARQAQDNIFTYRFLQTSLQSPCPTFSHKFGPFLITLLIYFGSRLHPADPFPVAPYALRGAGRVTRRRPSRSQKASQIQLDEMGPHLK